MPTETILWILIVLISMLIIVVGFVLFSLSHKIEQSKDLNPLHTKVDLTIQSRSPLPLQVVG